MSVASQFPLSLHICMRVTASRFHEVGPKQQWRALQASLASYAFLVLSLAFVSQLGRRRSPSSTREKGWNDWFEVCQDSSEKMLILVPCPSFHLGFGAYKNSRSQVALESPVGCMEIMGGFFFCSLNSLFQPHISTSCFVRTRCPSSSQFGLRSLG